MRLFRSRKTIPMEFSKRLSEDQDTKSKPGHPVRTRIPSPDHSTQSRPVQPDQTSTPSPDQDTQSRPGIQTKPGSPVQTSAPSLDQSTQSRPGHPVQTGAEPGVTSLQQNDYNAGGGGGALNQEGRKLRPPCPAHPSPCSAVVLTD